VALAELAWNHFCNEFAVSRGDRRVIVARMKKLLAGPFGLGDKAHQNIVADMERTLAKREAEAGSLEASVDALMDLDVEGSWPGCGYARFNNYAHWNAHYRRLRNKGLQAVPVLLRHVDDYRLTRCLQTTSDGRYTWHVRLADVVALLLNGLVSEPFAYDFRRLDGRGVSLDRDHVRVWWQENGQKRELDYLLAVVMRHDEPDRNEPNGHVLHVLGARYPDELVKLFEAQIKAGKGAGAFFEALAESKVSAKTKEQLFLAAAKSDHEWTRVLAQRELVRHHRAAAVPVILQALDDLPKTPAEPYWTANTGSIAQSAFDSDDPKVWEALEKTAKRVDVGQRLEILGALGQVRGADERRRAIRFLKGFLDDTEVRDRNSSKLFDGPCVGFLFPRLAVRDFALEKLAFILDLHGDPDPTWTEADWTKLRKRVQAAVAKLEQENRGEKEGQK
jgi:hypothetical protein